MTRLLPFLTAPFRRFKHYANVVRTTKWREGVAAGKEWKSGNDLRLIRFVSTDLSPPKRNHSIALQPWRTYHNYPPAFFPLRNTFRRRARHADFLHLMNTHINEHVAAAADLPALPQLPPSYTVLPSSKAAARTRALPVLNQALPHVSMRRFTSKHLTGTPPLE